MSAPLMGKHYRIAGCPRPVNCVDVELFADAMSLALAFKRDHSFVASTGRKVIVRERQAHLPIRDGLRYLHDCVHGVVTLAGAGRAAEPAR